MYSSQQQLIQEIDKIYAKYDKDNSGYLDINEIQQMLNEYFFNDKHSRKATLPDVFRFLSMMDQNRNAVIQKRELVEAFKKYFGHL